MGDCIAGLCVSDRLIEAGYAVTYAAHRAFHSILKYHPGIISLKDETYIATVTLDGAYEKHSQRTTRSFSELFVAAANQQIQHTGITLKPINCRPRLGYNQNDAEACLRHFVDKPKPWVIMNPRAAPHWHGRHVPNRIWQAAAEKIKGTCFWMGQDPAPAGIVDLRCRDVAVLAPMLSHADLLVTVDTGPLHLAAAIGKPVLAILQSSSPALHLSDQVDYWMISPNLTCLNCQKNVCPINAVTPPCQNIDPDQISNAVNRRFDALNANSVSCVIPIWKPTAERVNRCLDAVLPQVSEVVISVDASGVVPPGIKLGGKVKLVHARLPRIGVGPNINHGARHTNGKYLLLLNDDVVLAPDAVSKMLEVFGPGVGMVGHLLYYPDRSIYHGGKYRPPGGLGWGHIDHRKHRPTVTEPVETENVTGASIMVTREAFYKVDGFDERYFLYNEDDDLCMKIRQAGYKIIYTPLATAVHEEGQTTRLIGDTIKIMKESQRIFAEKWKGYFDHNQSPGIGNFNYA